MVFKEFHTSQIIEKIQDLEGIGGPDSLEEYIEILKTVKSEIETRIKNANQLLKGDTL